MPPARRSSTRSKVSWTLLVLVSRLNPLYPTTRLATSGRRWPPSAPQLSPLFPQNTPADPELAPPPPSPFVPQPAVCRHCQLAVHIPRTSCRADGFGWGRQQTQAHAPQHRSGCRGGSAAGGLQHQQERACQEGGCSRACGGLSRPGVVTQPPGMRGSHHTSHTPCVQRAYIASKHAYHSSLYCQGLPSRHSATRTRPLRISPYICTGSCL